MTSCSQWPRAGKLHEPDGAAAPGASACWPIRARYTLATNFAFQWLNLAKLAEIEPDPAIFPYASGAADLRDDFQTEICAVHRQRLPQRPAASWTCCDSNYTFLNERLALQYDINNVRGDQFRKVAAQGLARAGACWARAAC